MSFMTRLRWPRIVRNEQGLTLIELMATLVISLMVGSVVLAVLWSSASRSNYLLGYNAAQRQVLLANHALTRELHTADFVQIQSTGMSPGTRQVVLWLYHGGYVANANLQPAWMYNTTTLLATAPTNNTTNTNVIGTTCFGAFIFTQQTDGTWNVLFTTTVPSSTSSSCSSSPLVASSLQSGALLNVSGLQVLWDFPNVFGDAGGTPVSVQCKFVNSFVIRLSTTYQTSTGKPTTYFLTAGYHDKDVR